MSEGPIKAWRDSQKPPLVSTSPTGSVHGPGPGGRAYCGRKGKTIGAGWVGVTCADCVAARRADS